jgi:hypothetical protein
MNDGYDAPHVDSGLTVPLNQWSFIGYSHRQDAASGAGTTTFFVNGATSTVSDTNVGAIGSTDPFLIGASGHNAVLGGYFNGYLDEVRVYDRAVSTDEMRRLYRLTTPTGTDTGLKGYWSFNGQDMSGTTAYDRSGAGNNGTLTNSPAVSEGRVGQALEFFPNGSDANAYINVGDPSSGSLDFGSGDFTTSLWVKSRGYSSQGSCCNMIVSKYNADAGAAPGYAMYYDSGNLPIFSIHDGTNETAATGATSLTTGWHHLVGVRSGTTAYLYVDGILEKTTTGSTASVSNSENFYIGASGTVSQRNVNAAVDEVRVYNRALSAAEVKAQYDASAPDRANTSVSTPQGTGRLDSGLAGYWKLDEGSGTSASDASTSGSTGTLTNGPTWTTGRIGSAVDFDGANDTIEATSVSQTDNLTQVSMCAWVNPDTSFPNGYGTIMKKGDTFAYWDLYLQDLTGSGYGIGTSAAGAGAQYDVVGSGAMQSQWSHICGVQPGNNSDNFRVYLNGVSLPVSTAGSFTRGADTGERIRIGADTASAYGFAGLIDDARIYDRALSDEEVRQIYQLTAPTGTDTGLKGYWSFNGQDMSGTTAYDRSGAGNDGTLTNGPAIAEGKLGQALSFDGTNDYVDMGDLNFMDGASVLTLSAWFKRSAASAQLTVGKIVNDNQRFDITMWTDGNVYVNNGDGAAPAYGAFVSNDTNWHHIVYVYDGNLSGNSNRTKAYLDGIVQSLTFTGTIPATTQSTTSSFVVGRNQATSTYSSGFIEEVRLYTSALSASEIKALYSSGR